MQLTRRQFLQRMTYSLAGLFTLTIGTGSYSMWMEPNWLEITHTTISLNRLPAVFHRFRIVQFSDLHLGDDYHPDDLAELILHIQKLKPDLICFTGDLIDKDLNSIGKTIPLLQQLKAPYGKYAVIGNHDYWGGAKEVSQALQRGGFQVLTNQHQIIRKDSAQLIIAGVDDQYEGSPDIKLALHQSPANTCTILLSHCPDYADIAKEYSVDLQLSGHSHGGQVRLPWFGHLITPKYAKKYIQGLERVSNSKLQIYTNRGIGTTLLPIRFFCRPELSVIELSTLSSSKR